MYSGDARQHSGGLAKMRNVDAKVLFGTIIVYILLLFWAYSVMDAINLAMSDPKPGPLDQGVSRTMATVGGLVSALVISQLAANETTEGLKLLFHRGLWIFGGKWTAERLVAWMKFIYVTIWIAVGVYAFVVGELWYPNRVAALNDFAQAWLGLAVAAGYSYFGLKK